MMFFRLFKQPLFIIGFSFLFIMMIGSLTYPYFHHADSEPVTVLYDENNIPIDNAPFSPSLKYPLGSDKLGHSVIDNLLEGAKYTIGLALCIAVVRLILSIVTGFVIFLLPQKLKLLLSGITDAFYYAPLTIFVYLLLAPMLVTFSWSYDAKTQIIFSAIVLIVLAVPILSLFIATEIEDTYREEFIQNARLLGGSRIHVFIKHVVPFLTPKLLVVFVQQIGQVLIIFAHLGLLKIFLGGSETRVMDVSIDGEKIIETFSLSHEWGGLIAKNFTQLMNYPWLVLGPVTAFALTILAVNFIVEGMKRASNQKVRRKKTKVIRDNRKAVTLSPQHFNTKSNV